MFTLFACLRAFLRTRHVRLVALRKARGLTQVQLAEKAQTTQRAISYYENDAGFPPAPALIALAEALQVSTDVLLGVKPPKVEHIDDDAEARRMWKRFQMVSILPERTIEWKRPYSSRLARTHNPLPSQNSSFSRLRRAFENTNTCPLSGSDARRSRTRP